MQALFGGNPFGSPLGQRIDKATDGELASEDWALNIEICDIINETEDGPKEAMRALRKKMQANAGKNYKVILYALTVLETCVKNCGKRFHAQVANKDFLQELVRIIGPKNDPPTIVQERILGLIQAWADAFQGSADFKEVEKIYDELRAKGVEFPMTDLDSLAPIHTPGRSSGRLSEQASGLAAGGVGGPAAAGRQASNSEVASAAMAQQQQIPLFAGAAGGGLVPSVTPTAEQLAKLRSELDVVQENCRIFSELLNDLSAGTAAATAAGGSQPMAAMMASNGGPTAHSCGDAELAHELNHACRQMQQRILELIECVSGGEVTEVLLQANDELNNLFLRYERHERYRSSRAAGAAAALASADARPPPAAVASAAGGSGPSANALGPSTATAADFSAHLATMSVHEFSSVSATLSQLGRTPAASAAATAAGGTSGDRPGDDDFDMFAASRQSFEQSRAEQRNASSAYNDQQQRTHAAGLGPVLSARHTPYTPSAPPPATAATASAPSADDMLSSDFNQFLLERARAQDGLPDVPPSVALSADAAALRGRQMQKDEETENALFSL